jgi:hypothetical protein
VPFLTVSDLVAFSPNVDPEKAQAMIDDASALAAVVAPCISAVGFAYPAAVKAILRGAILRWLEAGTGARQAVSVGQVGITNDTRQERRGMFQPSEIVQLQSLCPTAGALTLSIATPDAAI